MQVCLPWHIGNLGKATTVYVFIKGKAILTEAHGTGFA